MTRLGLALAMALVACRRDEPDDAMRAKPAAGLEIKLCSAYVYEPDKTHAIVIDVDGKPGDLVTYQDHQYNVHPRDCLRYGAGEIRDIRWHLQDGTPFVGIRFTDQRLGARSEDRMSQLDATYLDGSLYMIALYDRVMSDTLWITNADPAKQRALFQRLTGVPPSP